MLLAVTFLSLFRDARRLLFRRLLFEDDEEISRYLALGLNENYDREIRFSPKDLVLIGGRRGAGQAR